MYLKPFDQLLARVRNMDYFLAHRVELTWNLDAEVKQLNFAISVDNNDWRSTERNIQRILTVLFRRTRDNF